MKKTKASIVLTLQSNDLTKISFVPNKFKQEKITYQNIG